MTLEEAIKIVKSKELNDLPQYRQLVFDYELLDAALIILASYEELKKEISNGSTTNLLSN